MDIKYIPKKETCPLCKGNKNVKAKLNVVMKLNLNSNTATLQDNNDNTCPHCHGTGEISTPPFGNGESALIEDEMVTKLAEAATLLRCIDEPLFVQAVANQAARITLPEDIVSTYVSYWCDPERDVTLGWYIRQIAETAEQLAMKIYGNLGNQIFTRPRIPVDKI